jgi:hypothetical protein
MKAAGRTVKISFEFPEHDKVILTNVNGDTYISKSEELMDFLHGTKTEPLPDAETERTDMTAKEFFTAPGSPLTLDFLNPQEKEFLLEMIELYAKGKVKQATSPVEAVRLERVESEWSKDYTGKVDDTKPYKGAKCLVNDGDALRNATVDNVDLLNKKYDVFIDGIGTKISNIPFTVWRPTNAGAGGVSEGEAVPDVIYKAVQYGMWYALNSQHQNEVPKGNVLQWLYSNYPCFAPESFKVPATTLPASEPSEGQVETAANNFLLENSLSPRVDHWSFKQGVRWATNNRYAGVQDKPGEGWQDGTPEVNEKFGESEYVLGMESELSVPVVCWYNKKMNGWYVAHHLAASIPITIIKWRPLSLTQ